jgi:hypothetical protein
MRHRHRPGIEQGRSVEDGQGLAKTWPSASDCARQQALYIGQDDGDARSLGQKGNDATTGS